MDSRLDKIYKQHGKYVYNVALGMLKNRDDAQDVTQNVFIKLFNSLDSFRGDSDIKTYLYRMAINSSIDYIRRQSTHRDKLEKMEPETSVSMPDSLSFYSLVDKLDDDHKAVLLLSEIGGFKYDEIADILQTKTGTVKSRASRAIVKLREILAKEVIK